jgi:hypothetical protein
MKKTVLEMAVLQVLLFAVLAANDLLAEARGMDVGMGTAVILSLIPGVLFCLLELPLRVQNHYTSRTRHVFACMGLWLLECAVFFGLAYAAVRCRLIPQRPADPDSLQFAHNGGEYYVLPVMAFLCTAAESLIWLVHQCLWERRRYLYRGDDTDAP